MSDQRPAERLLPGGRWPVTDPADRLDELGNMVGAQLVPGVLVDELYEIAVRHRAEVERLRGLLGRLEWSGSDYVNDDGSGTPMCPVCDHWRPAGHKPDCWLAAELHPDPPSRPPQD